MEENCNSSASNSLINHKEYSELIGIQKVRFLIQCVKANVSDIARILETEESEIKVMLEDPFSNDDKSNDLLTIFAYLMRLAAYDQKIMRNLWSARYVFRSSLNSPPWDASGLNRYLIKNGLSGVKRANKWIKEN